MAAHGKNIGYTFHGVEVPSHAFPSNIDAEKGVLGAFLIDSGLFGEYVGRIDLNDFFDPRNRIIFESMVRVFSKCSSFSSIMLYEDMQAQGVYYDAGGTEYVVALQENFSVLGFLEQHVLILKEKSSLRKIISAASSLISSCFSRGSEQIGSLVDSAEKMLFEIASSKIGKSFESIDFSLKRAFETLVKNSQVANYNRGITGVPSGYHSIDSITGGFQNGDLIILAARPSMGKTALGLCMAHRAAHAGFSVGIVSLEMSTDQIVFRLLSIDSRIRLLSLRSGMLHGDEWSRLTESAARLSGMKIFIDDTPLQTILDIRTRARKLAVEQNVKIIIVDYLQLLNSDKKHDSRQQEVSEISRFLKSLARELNIPIIALSQLSRGVEGRVDKRPMLADLRDSGAIEQDADLILFVYRDVVYNPDTEIQNAADVIVGKHRNGPIGNAPLCFFNEFASFDDAQEI